MSERPPLRTIVARDILGPLILFATLAVLVTADAWANPTVRWVGGCCDPEQTIWFLRWIPTALEQGVNPLLTGQMNAPGGVNLMWNTSIPLVGLVMTPVTLLGGPILAYNVAVVAAIATSAWACYLALRRLAGGRVGPLAGGVVYGFSPYVVSHAALHLDLIAVWTPPVLLVLLVELLVRRRYRPLTLGLWLGVVAGLQMLVFEELLATSAIAATVLAVILAVVAPDRREVAVAGRRIARAALPAAISFLVVAAWPLSTQFLGPQRVSGRVQDTGVFATDLLNVIVPTRYQLFSPDLATAVSDQFSGLFHEATAYLGLPLAAFLTVLLVTRWTDLRIRVAGLVAVCMAVLSMGPTLHVGGGDTGIPMPWLPFTVLPLIEQALPGRLTLYMWLAIAVMVAVVVEELLRRTPSFAAPRLVLLGIALIVAAPAPLRSSTAEVPAFFATWERQGIADDAVILMAPYFTNGAGADPMLWAAVAGNRPRMYEAYAFVPGRDGKPSYGPPATQLTDIMAAIQDGDGTTIVARGDVRSRVLRDLEDAGITEIIVGPMRNRAPMVAFFTDLLDRSPEEVDGVQLWRGVAGSR